VGNLEFAKMMVLVVPLGLAVVIGGCLFLWAMGSLLLGAHPNPWLPP
jgi:hypothetical protein